MLQMELNTWCYWGHLTVVLDIASITTLTICANEVGFVYGAWVVADGGVARCLCNSDLSGSNAPTQLEPTSSQTTPQHSVDEILVVYTKRYPLNDLLADCQQILYHGLFSSLKRSQSSHLSLFAPSRNKPIHINFPFHFLSPDQRPNTKCNNTNFQKQYTHEFHD